MPSSTILAVNIFSSVNFSWCLARLHTTCSTLSWPHALHDAGELPTSVLLRSVLRAQQQPVRSHVPCPQRNAHLFASSPSDNKLTFSCLPQKHLESYLADCSDAIAVFLCIHIVLRFRSIAAKRDVPALDRSLSSGPWCLEALSLLSHTNNSVLTPGSSSPDALHPDFHSRVPGAALGWAHPFTVTPCSPGQPAPLAR